MKAAFVSAVEFGTQTVRRINKKQGWRFADGQRIGQRRKQKEEETRK